MTALPRAHAGVAGRKVRRSIPWWALLWLGLATWVAAIVLSPTKSTVTHQDLADLARNLDSGVFLVAGVVLLATWRLTGDAVVGRRAVAFLVVAASFPGSAAVGPLLHEPATFAHGAPSTRALFLIPVIALLLPRRGAPTGSSEHAAHPVPLHHLVAIGWGIGTVIGVALYARHTLHPQALAIAWRLICVVSAGAWLLLAVRASRRPGRRGVPRLLVTVCLLMAVAEVFRLAAIQGEGSAVGVAPGVQLAAATLLVVMTLRDLRAVRRSEEESAAHLVRTVTRLQGSLAAIEVADRERLHDARSAVVGVIGASELLAAPAGHVDADRLRRLITAELRRVQSVLDPRADEPSAEFDLAEALAPVVLSHQLHDRPVVSAVQPVVVVGRARATATVLDNLLRNASVHAPGARVTVRTEVLGRHVAVVVEDDGPGIPEADRARVLRAGVRGAAAHGDGEGLGLHSSLSAMRAQGGSLCLESGEGVGTRVTFTLPIAAAVTAAAPGPAPAPRTIRLDQADPALARGA